MSIGFTIKVENAKDVMGKMRRLGKDLKPSQILHAIGFRHLKWVSDNLRLAGIDKKHTVMAPNTIAANPTRSSRRHFSSRFRSVLNQSFTSKVRGNFVVVGTMHQFAAFHHFGTKPTIITPRNAKFLTFKTVGGIRRAKSVKHPGVPSRPLIPTKIVGGKLAEDVLEAVIRKATAEFNRGV